MAQIQNTDKLKCSQEQELAYIDGGDAEEYGHFGKECGSFL